MVLEAGKTWYEADADTSEAIDFLDYYARQAVRIADASDQLTPYLPEQLGYYNIPLGVGAVIPPWNFPNAIPTGMLGAALVTGNTVVFKPAEQTPWIAWHIAELFWQQGLPSGVLNFLTGRPQLPDRPRRGGRCPHGAKPIDPLHQLHRFQSSRVVDLRAGRQSPTWPALAQTRHFGDGRQRRRIGR